MIQVLVIMGPTAGGKSALAVELAAQAGREIVSADSRQIYQGLRIGTAQPSAEERERVPHNLVDFLPLGQSYSAQRFVDDALALIRERPDAPPLVVGGTGFYLRSLWEGLFVLNADEDLLAAARAELETHSTPELRSILESEDPESAGRLHPNDRQRTVRALEVLRATGQVIGEHHRRGRKGPEDIAWHRVLVHRERPVLRRLIAERTEAMFAAGWVEELRDLLAAGADPHWPGMRSLGYPEIAALLRGEIDEAEAKRRIVDLTRQFARRQDIWFGKERFEEKIDPEDEAAIENLARRLADRG